MSRWTRQRVRERRELRFCRPDVERSDEGLWVGCCSPVRSQASPVSSRMQCAWRSPMASAFGIQTGGGSGMYSNAHVGLISGGTLALLGLLFIYYSLPR